MLPADVLDAVRPPRMRPAMWHALEELARRRDECMWHHHALAWNDFRLRHREFRGLWARTAELAALGFELIDAQNPEYVRVEGCVWFTEFPSTNVVAHMARIALDPREPLRVRDQATWTLGFRQLQESDDALHWTPDVVAAADEALLALWRSPDRAALGELAPALRHVSSPAVLDALAEDPVAAAPALEAFATPRLARAILERLPDVASEHAPRLVRLVGHVLGPDCVDALLAYAERAPLAESVEALMTSLALDAARARPAVDRFLDGLTFDAVFRARADFHEAHPGVLPTVRALAIARTTATIEPSARTAACLSAARDFASLGRIEPFAEQYLYAMWRHVAFRARDDAAIVECAESTPSTLEDAPFLVAPYLDALARAGRTDRLAIVARTHAATAHATWLLATRGRPFAALAMERLATDHDPDAVAGGAIALFLAGRPDLAELVLVRDPPRAKNLAGVGIASFPGADERWRAEHEPESCPALAALVTGGLPALLAHVRGAPEGGDADGFDFELLLAREKELRRDLAGASVCILGQPQDAAALARWLEAQGARLVDGPFAKADYFVAAPDADPTAVARLRAMGVRELPAP